MDRLPDQQVATLQDAARKLTGTKRRAFQAQVTLDYLDGSARRAETVFSWYRKTVELGLHELRTGIRCVERFSARGNRKSEEKHPQLEQDIRVLAEPESQVDPKFQSPFLYTRITAQAMRTALIEQKGWADEDLPCEKTIGNILNRLGYRLRRVQKARANRRDLRQRASPKPSLRCVLRFLADLHRYQGQGRFGRFLAGWSRAWPSGDASL